MRKVYVATCVASSLNANRKEKEDYEEQSNNFHRDNIMFLWGLCVKIAF